MKYVAVYNFENERFSCCGKPTFMISDFTKTLYDISIENKYYVESPFLRMIVRKNSSENIDKCFTEFSRWINVIYTESDKLFNKDIDHMFFGNPFISKFPDVTPHEWSHQTYKYEYDVHAAYASLLNYNYYLSETDDGHVNSKIAENPLINIHSVIVKNGKLCICENDTHKRLFLCSKFSSIHTEYEKLILRCYSMIKECKSRIDIDCSSIIYPIVISQVIKSIKRNHFVKLNNTYQSLLQLSSLEILKNSNDGNFVNFYADAVQCYEIPKISQEFPKIVGKRYYRENRKLGLTQVCMHYNHSVIDLKDKENDELKEIDGAGWVKYSTLANTDTFDELYHVDIHNAYPREYYDITSKNIQKTSIGIVKMNNSRLYQEVRERVAVKSLGIFEKVGRKNVIYWKTDGGIVTSDKALKVLSDEILVEKINHAEELCIPEHIKKPKDYKDVWAYNITTKKGSKIYWTNGYQDNNMKKIKKLLDINSIHIENITPYNVCLEFYNEKHG